MTQTVTVSAAHDEDWEDDSVVLTHTGGQAEYEGLSEDLPVTVDDNTGDIRLVDGARTTDGRGPLRGTAGDLLRRGVGDHLRRLLERRRCERGLPAAGIRRRNGVGLGLLQEPDLPHGR